MSRRILVIDDEQGIRAALGQLLEYEGYEVHTLANAADGIAEYQKWRPHLVFLDVKMAGMDGMEALKKHGTNIPASTLEAIQRAGVALNGRQLADGYVLLCIARALGDCTFDVGVESHDRLYRNPFASPLAPHELKPRPPGAAGETP